MGDAPKRVKWEEGPLRYPATVETAEQFCVEFQPDPTILPGMYALAQGGVDYSSALKELQNLQKKLTDGVLLLSPSFEAMLDAGVRGLLAACKGLERNPLQWDNRGKFGEVGGYPLQRSVVRLNKRLGEGSWTSGYLGDDGVVYLETETEDRSKRDIIKARESLLGAVRDRLPELTELGRADAAFGNNNRVFRQPYYCAIDTPTDKEPLLTPIEAKIAEALASTETRRRQYHDEGGKGQRRRVMARLLIEAERLGIDKDPAFLQVWEALLALHRIAQSQYQFEFPPRNLSRKDGKVVLRDVLYPAGKASTARAGGWSPKTGPKKRNPVRVKGGAAPQFRAEAPDKGSEVYAFMLKVAEAYNAAPLFDEAALPSYKALRDAVDARYQQLMSSVDVEFAPGQPYATELEMREDFEKNRRLRISTDYNEHPFFTPEENLRFRAVHDWYAHLIRGAVPQPMFSQRGELLAFNREAKVMPQAAIPALFTEIVGQAAVYTTSGEFPPQKVALLPGFDLYNVGKEKNPLEWDFMARRGRVYDMEKAPGLDVDLMAHLGGGFATEAFAGRDAKVYTSTKASDGSKQLMQELRAKAPDSIKDLLPDVRLLGDDTPKGTNEPRKVFQIPYYLVYHDGPLDPDWRQGAYPAWREAQNEVLADLVQIAFEDVWLRRSMYGGPAGWDLRKHLRDAAVANMARLSPYWTKTQHAFAQRLLDAIGYLDDNLPMQYGFDFPDRNIGYDPRTGDMVLLDVVFEEPNFQARLSPRFAAEQRKRI